MQTIARNEVDGYREHKYSELQPVFIKAKDAQALGPKNRIKISLFYVY